MQTSTEIRLRGLLASREYWTAQSLALELGVSLRTVRRGLRLLRDQGLEVDAQSGRGGGLRLTGSSGTRAVDLQHREVLDLLLALAIAQSLQSPLLLQSVRSLRHKLGNTFAPGQRRQVDRLRHRVLVGARASAEVQSTVPAISMQGVETLQDAFLHQRLLRLRYRDAQGVASVRTVEPQCLLINVPVWYLLAWDRTRQAPRTFRLDRMSHLQMLPDSFVVRPASTLLHELGTYFTSL